MLVSCSPRQLCRIAPVTAHCGGMEPALGPDIPSVGQKTVMRQAEKACSSCLGVFEPESATAPSKERSAMPGQTGAPGDPTERGPDRMTSANAGTTTGADTGMTGKVQDTAGRVVDKVREAARRLVGA